VVLDVIGPLLRLIDVHQTWLWRNEIVWASHHYIGLLALNCHVLVVLHLLLLAMINLV
jgi:hypothetical protein